MKLMKNSAPGQEIAVVKVSTPNIENALFGVIEGNLCDFRPGEKCYRSSQIVIGFLGADFGIIGSLEGEDMLRAAGYTVIDSTAVLVFMNYTLTYEYAVWYSSPYGEEVKLERYEEAFLSEPEARAALWIARKKMEDSGHTLLRNPSYYSGTDGNGRPIWIIYFNYIKNIPAAGSGPAAAKL